MNSNAAAKSLLELLHTPSLPELGPGRRPDAFSETEIMRRLDRFFGDFAMTGGTQQLVRSAALLWHDHLDASHTLSQEIHTPDGSFLHAIMHRREPDASNSKYWWHRVGTHAAFREIASRVGEHLERSGDRVQAVRLLPRGEWDPIAFVEVCEHARHRGSTSEKTLCMEIQRIEFETFLEHVLGLVSR